MVSLFTQTLVVPLKSASAWRSALIERESSALVIQGTSIQNIFGLAIGLPCAVLGVRFVEATLYDIEGVDAKFMLTAILSLLLTAGIVALIPTRRAASIDPVQAL
jgi:ABC-type lipoprotein release transport system permease subunit